MWRTYLFYQNIFVTSFIAHFYIAEYKITIISDGDCMKHNYNILLKIQLQVDKWLLTYLCKGVRNV